MTTALLEEKLASIPKQYWGEVATFLDFLSYRIENSKMQHTSAKRTPERIKDKIYMSDDFDTPLNDFKEYM